jgi:hypothetical protein
MRRSTPGVGEGAHSERAPWIATRAEKSAFNLMTEAPSELGARLEAAVAGNQHGTSAGTVGPG